MIMRIITLIFSVFMFNASLGVAVQAADYDIIIRGGRVLDGAGNPFVLADVAIKGGKIVKVGVVNGSADQEIDATGKYVSPGFIDMMDQSGYVLRKNGLAENKLWMGVTTAIGGEGGTPVPENEIGAYFDELTSKGISINFGSYYSISQARIAEVGEGDTQPNATQMKAMAARVETAMKQGAMGLSTALIYPPDAYLSTEQIVAMAKVAAPYGGLYASHMRSEGRNLLDAIKEVIRISEEGGVRAEIFHLKNAWQPNWGAGATAAIELVEGARARGVDIAADQYPYPAGGTGLDATIPQYVFADGMEKAIALLSDSTERAKMKKHIMDPANDSLIAASGGWERIVLANSHLDEYRRFHNKNFAEIGKALGKDPADVSWDIFVKAVSGEKGADGEWIREPARPMALFFMMSEEDIATLMARDWVSIGSDAGAALKPGAMDGLGLPHPRSYGTFPRILAKYVREDKVLSLPEAVRKMTSWPATRLRLNDRGLIRKGMWADVVVFDADTVKDMATWDDPMAKPAGIDYVLVNGQVVMDHGNHTGVRSGMIMYGAGKE